MPWCERAWAVLELDMRMTARFRRTIFPPAITVRLIRQTEAGDVSYVLQRDRIREGFVGTGTTLREFPVEGF